MFKRLIIAVLALGFTLGLSGTAFSDVDNPKQIQTDPVQWSNPSDPRFNSISLTKAPQIPANRIPTSELRTVSGGDAVPPAHTPAAVCGYIWYHNPTATFYFRHPDYYTAPPWSATNSAVRFSTDPGIRCTLQTGSVLIHRGLTRGNAGLRVYLYDDDGFGLPGAKLDSVSFPLGSFVGAGTVWADADFSPAGWVFENGEQYHIGIAAITDSPDDSIAFLADNGTGHTPATPFRNTVYLAGSGYNYWTTYSSILASAADVGLIFEAEVCCDSIPFTDCYTQSYHGSIAYFWAAPHAVYGDSAYAMRFDVGGPETLASVDFTVYNATASSSTSKGSAYVFGDDIIRVKVYSDVAGLPGVLLATVNVPGGSYSAYPAYTNAVFAPLVLSSNFHVALSSSGTFGLDCEAFLSDNGSTATGRGSTAYPGAAPPYWESMLSAWGLDAAFLIHANMCRDEFSACHVKQSWDGPLGGGFAIPDADAGSGPWTRWAQKFTANEGSLCELRSLVIPLRASTADNADAATRYTKNTHVVIYSDAGNNPGAVLGTAVLTPADYAAAGFVGYPGFSYNFLVPVNLDPLDIQVFGDFWVSLEPQTTLYAEGIRDVADATPPPGYENIHVYDPEGAGFPPGTWGDADIYGLIHTQATQVSYCCIPFVERACAGTSDWTRAWGNQASDGTSQVSLSDSWCDLNRLWSYSETNSLAATVFGSGPIIYEGKVVSNFYDNYKKFDLGTGALEYTWGPGATGIGGGNSIGAPLSGSGTVATITISGVPTEVLFLGGGGNNNMIAVNWNTHATIWGVPVGPNDGPIRGGAFIVLSSGATDNLFYTTNSGNVVRRNADDGVAFGAPFPVSLGGNSSEVTGATDGTDLYFSTNPAANGSIYKITQAGTVVWSLPASSLKGTLVYPTEAVTRELFSAGVTVGGGAVYAVSTFPTGFANFPADGVYYKLNAGTGAVEGYSVSERAFRQAPILDVNRALVPTFSRWGGGTLGGCNAIAFSRLFSTIDWTFVHPEQTGAMYGALSCETGAPDQLFLGAAGGWLNCVNADDGDEIYNRRWDDLAATLDIFPRGVAIGNGSGTAYVAVGTRSQYLIALRKGSDRSRMEFQSYNFVGPVDFGSNPALVVNLGTCLTNTGCFNLDIGTVTPDENPFVARIPLFSLEQTNETQAMSRAGNLADLLTQSSFASAKGVVERSDIGSNELTPMNGLENRDNRNRAASAAPPWLVSITHPASTDNVAPGDSLDLELVVDQNLINRGPNTMYVQVASNDPDFFLNDPAGLPQFQVTLVGGCLLDTTWLHFGAGGANIQYVWNTGRLGDGDVTPSHGFLIDGAGTVYFQGSYVYLKSQRRWAVNTPEWFSNVDDELISLQADPNWCDTTCKPFLTSPYNVGSISATGLIYTPINANMICRSYLDSVQNFDNGAGGWDVTQYSAAPFDNDSTMGLYVNSRVVGAVNEPSLTNVTVDLMTITERNGVAMPGIFVGSMNDYDLGGGDTVGMQQSISTAYAWRRTGANGIWGQIKLPFGCGHDPVRNTRGMGGAQGFFAGGGVGLNAYFDSTYLMMQAASGSITSQAAPNASDFEQHITYYTHDFTPGETVEIGVAHFGFPNQSNASTTTTTAPAAVQAMARQVNKWTGWGRGDVNNDNLTNLADIVYLAGYVNFSGPGPIPFMHLGDVDASGGLPNQADVTYLINYYFNCGPCPDGEFVF